MNTMVKLSVASAMAFGYATANAGSVVLPSTGNADLILFVQDESSASANFLDTYALDTGISINSLLPSSSLLPSGTPAGTFSPNPVLLNVSSSNFSLTADANLTSFLTATSGDTLDWAVEAAQYPTNSNDTGVEPTGSSKFLTTTIDGPATVSGTSVNDLTSWGAGLNGDIKTLNTEKFSNGSTKSTFGLQGSTTSGGWNTSLFASNNDNWYGFGPETVGNAIGANALGTGASVELYGLTGDGNANQAQVYDLGAITLAANGTLSFTANSGGGTAVPLPAAAWLFGSGLLSLAGIGRRRQANS